MEKGIPEDHCHLEKKPDLQVGSGGEVTPHPGPSRSVPPSQPVALEISVVAATRGPGG